MSITEIERQEAEYNCLMAGTPVVLEDGSTALIENLVRQRRRIRVLSQDDRGRICTQPIVDWHKKRVVGQEWICVKTTATHAGHRGLILTPEHKVFTLGGEVAARDLTPGTRIFFPEALFTLQQTQAVWGTLLGDSRLVCSPVHRGDFLHAPNFALDGGHIEESGWAQYKVLFLAPHAQLGSLHPSTTKKIAGKQTVSAPFRCWRTKNLHQLTEFAADFYHEDGSRRLSISVLGKMGMLGLAWWFADDGCRQNKVNEPDTVTLALCRYSREEAEQAQRWFTDHFGKVYLGADRVLRFPRETTEVLCEQIAPFIIPQLRYKLPQGESWPAFRDVAVEQKPGRSAWTDVVSVESYLPKTRTASERLKAETRFCITVANTHRFFTSFGLVRNCRDVLGMCRAFPHLDAELERTNTVNVYEYDELMADLALQMTRIGMPVNSERRAEIGARLRTLRDNAIEAMRPYTEGEYREGFLDWVASFFAVKARKGEPIAGSIRLGPTRATAEYEEARTALAEWKAYRKQLDPAAVDEVADTDIQIEELTEQVKLAKLALNAAQYVPDEEDGLPHTEETAYAVRHAIRRAQAIMAIDKKGVNFGAKVQQCAILRAAGVPLHRKTEKTGLPKIDKEVLESLGRHPAAKALLTRNLVQSTINTYIEGEKRAGKGSGESRPVLVSESGYINPLWKVNMITGRWSSSPNVSNWSKRAGGGEENLRSMIEAPDGYTLIGADQKQIEARLIGGMSQCQYMIDTFRSGGDIHGAFAAIGFPNEWPRLAAIFADHKKAGKCTCKDCNTRNQMRDRTKNLEYGAFYGGKEQKLFEAIAKDFPDATLGQVREFLRRFNEMLPEVLRWREQVLDEAIREGEIRSPILGRRQVFPLGRVDPNVAYNYKAQSGAADIWAIGAAKFMQLWDQEAFDARLINNSHDSVLILVREDLAEKVEQDVYSCWNMEWNGVPFEMESKIAKQWSET